MWQHGKYFSAGTSDVSKDNQGVVCPLRALWRHVFVSAAQQLGEAKLRYCNIRLMQLKADNSVPHV